jgi:hypothetical protein
LSVSKDGWTGQEPYTQVIRALLPRAAGVHVFDAAGEIRWSSEASQTVDLPHQVRRSLAAQTSLGEAGERVLVGNEPPI